MEIGDVVWTGKICENCGVEITIHKDEEGEHDHCGIKCFIDRILKEPNPPMPESLKKKLKKYYDKKGTEKND